MTPPKKREIPFWDGEISTKIERYEYISVNHLKEWIEKNTVTIIPHHVPKTVYFENLIHSEELLKFIDEP